VLSQNTTDKASQPAHESLLDRYGHESRNDSERSSSAEQSAAGRSSDTRGDRRESREANGEERPVSGQGPREDGERRDPRDEDDLAASLADAEQSELAETIASAGLYNQKSETLIRLATQIVEEYGGADGFDEFVKGESRERVRETLLEMKGVGPKTADCVLLFSGGRRGVFPVDTHVHRIARRMGLAPADADHEAVREALERDVPAEKCGFGHTATIQFGREFCTARAPACLDDPDACPLADLCDQVGVYPETGEVVDPCEAPEMG
jgi:endonuclease-3